ncbi:MULTISPECIES: hypothetical protein [unclassified Mesorhizobium]|uniref:hypothetical protein n=1 Tax=unclassified Mesorhizobium TaxID=325217 RepID=UPI0012686ACD|nr:MULTISPECIES: hypothetical protein [unclassified Mesorhizobium]
MQTYVLTVRSRPSTQILAAIASYLSDSGYRVTNSSWVDRDKSSGSDVKIAFQSEAVTTLKRLSEGFAAFADRLQIEWVLHDQPGWTKTLHSALISAMPQPLFASALRTGNGSRT